MTCKFTSPYAINRKTDQTKAVTDRVQVLVKISYKKYSVGKVDYHTIYGQTKVNYIALLYVKCI